MLHNHALNVLDIERPADDAQCVADLNRVNVQYTRPDGEEVVAMREVSLQLVKGELLVMVGASGSGKTTALNVIAGLQSPTSGTATIFGNPPDSQRRKLGYMFARDALLPWRTARQNIEFGLELRGIASIERANRSKALLDLVGLRRCSENYPSELSQGQRQRVALARTWALEPEILLMDEPFSALDAQTREDLQAEFVRLWQRDMRSVVFVTHDLNEALTLADRIIVFSKGEIVRNFRIDLERPRDILSVANDTRAREIFSTIRDILSH